MTAYFKILRPLNLTMIAVTQWLLWFLMSERYLPEAALEGHLIWLFIFDTMLIAGAGYVINDIVDYQADLVNKPMKTFIGRRISLDQGWRYYWALVVLGLAISVYLATALGEMPLLWIYPVAVGLLYLYSKTHKRQPLIGNFLVSLFCAWVPVIILVAERSALDALLETNERNALLLCFVVGGYALVAFLANMAREVVKDIEDLEGDSQAGYRTLPLVIGAQSAKYIALAFIGSVLVLVGFTLWLSWRIGYIEGLRAVSVLLLPLTILIIYELGRATEKAHYKKVSRMIKILMGLSLVLVIVLSL